MKIGHHGHTFSDYKLRDGLRRFGDKLRPDDGSLAAGTGRPCGIAFLGGSVTAGAGASAPERTSWRAMTCQYFNRTYPHVSFRFTNAAVGGTDSTYGAFRFRQDVLERGAVDLLLVEFAVNDARNRAESVRAMEGIVRQARAANPDVDIVFVYTAHQSGVERLLSPGEIDANIASHEEVAGHYGLPSVDLSAEVARRIGAGDFDWDAFSADNVHPRDFGYALYAELMQTFLAAAAEADSADSCAGAAEVGPALPPPLDPLCYEHARLIGLDAVAADIASGSGWTRISGFAPAPERTCNWTPPADILLGETPGDSLTLTLDGTKVGFVLLAGPDTGAVDISVDEGPAVTFDLFDSYCPKFYRPKIWLLGETLSPGPHTVRLSVAAQKNEESLGHSLHIWKFMEN
ncbi:GDSL-type esterase/lipase family protein [Cohnella sp. 56]|uniref:GDSL-type esterase/lipase family protein n=1 Tax=Cohnella sp. 56 TaxID=3113722 RepID=UPI0030E7A73B